MRCVVAVLALAAAAAASDLSLANGYLPPPPACPTPPVVTKYSTRYVTRSVVRPVVQTDVRVQTQQVITTRLVRSEVVRTAVQEVPTYEYSSRVVTVTQPSYTTRLVTVPGQTHYQQQTVTRVLDKLVAKEVVRTVYSTLVQPTTVVRTLVQTRYSITTRYVPQYTTVYSTVHVAGPTKYVTTTRQVVKTQVETQQQPTVQLTKYQTRYSTVYRTVQVPGPTVISTSTQYQTKDVVSTYVQQRTQYVTETVRERVPRDKYVTHTRYVSRVSTQVVYSTKVVPRYVTKTKVVDVPRLVTVTNRRVVTVRLPTYPVYRTAYDTRVVYTTVPGAYREQTQYQYVTSTQVVPVTRTSVTTQYQVQTVTKTEPCGYRYDAPSVPFSY